MAFQNHPSIPDYSQMVMEAIEYLNSKTAHTSTGAIANYIGANYADLLPTHATHVGITLEKLKQTGQITLLKDDTYTINQQQEEEEDNDEELADEPTNGLSPSPIKRGRGRPPKPKANTPAGPGPTQPVRPRGRPPKERDPLAPVTRPTKPPPSGRPRGRPRKNPSEVGVSTGGGTGVVGDVKRGRGRPRKS